jgi:hypothetical protein
MIDLAQAAHEAATVRKATPRELDSLAAVLARAFYDDPVARWMVTDDGRRLGFLQRNFRLFLRRLWFAQDECYTTENVAGAIVWELPGRWRQITHNPQPRRPARPPCPDSPGKLHVQR